MTDLTLHTTAFQVVPCKIVHGRESQRFEGTDSMSDCAGSPHFYRSGWRGSNESICSRASGPQAVMCSYLQPARRVQLGYPVPACVRLRRVLRALPGC